MDADRESRGAVRARIPLIRRGIRTDRREYDDDSCSGVRAYERAYVYFDLREYGGTKMLDRLIGALPAAGLSFQTRVVRSRIRFCYVSIRLRSHRGHFSHL